MVVACVHKYLIFKLYLLLESMGRARILPCESTSIRRSSTPGPAPKNAFFRDSSAIRLQHPISVPARSGGGNPERLACPVRMCKLVQDMEYA